MRAVLAQPPLRPAQGGRAALAAQQGFVEALDEFASGLILHVPQGQHQGSRSRQGKPALESEHSFALVLFPQARLTRG
jgi:hypothetical protein